MLSVQTQFFESSALDQSKNVPINLGFSSTQTQLVQEPGCQTFLIDHRELVKEVVETYPSVLPRDLKLIYEQAQADREKEAHLFQSQLCLHLSVPLNEWV